ncbi:MAG: response regulator [Candidatus Moranbacteria bacterium]|nr:response regulator [Candidatus Moranbacteria bacterium]
MDEDKSKKIIMIVEDDSFVMDIYNTKFTQTGYAVVGALNGQEALKKMEETKPDLILLDIVMPQMDGYEFLKIMKSREEFKNIPVVLLTNLNQKEEIEKGMDLGAQDYLIKSHFTPSEVLAKVEKMLNVSNPKQK